MAWLTVFFPALAYFIVTRLSASGGSFGRFTELGEVVTSTIHLPLSSTNGDTLCNKLSSIFYVSSCKPSDYYATLSRSLNLVQTSGLENVQASCWRHDPEAGRGYLLLSQSEGRGRVWRWEVGGGPIPIGKTLHLEASGCRSGTWHDCEAAGVSSSPSGSGGMSVDFLKQDHYAAGRLVVAEWGEGRIARLEPNGARTPLVIQTPNICHDNTNESSSELTRLHAPSTLLYTPFGDLLVADNNPDCQRTALFRLRQAVHVTPVLSLAESRLAHNWTTVAHRQPMNVVFAPDHVKAIGGMTLDSSWTGIYLAVEGENGVLLYHCTLPGDDDADVVSNEEKDSSEEKQLVSNWKMILNLTYQLLSERERAGSVVMDGFGNMFVAVSNGVAIVQVDRGENAVGTLDQGELVGTLEVGARPRSLTVGEDGFLYLALPSQLLRIPIKTRAMKIPTNLVPAAKKSY